MVFTNPLRARTRVGATSPLHHVTLKYVRTGPFNEPATFYCVYFLRLYVFFRLESIQYLYYFKAITFCIADLGGVPWLVRAGHVTSMLRDSYFTVIGATLWSPSKSDMPLSIG